MKSQQIHEYSVIKQLGKGSYGRVYLVESAKKKLYALKSIEVTEQDIARAKQQAHMYIALEHQNIVKAHEFFSYDKEQKIAIVLDYFPDGDLSKLIGKIDSDASKKIIKQIAEGLVYLHNKKIIHRDIKPENVLMMNGVAKIADMGISRLTNTSGASTKILTWMYGAPQFFHQEKYNFKVDIWSLGILSLELLTGKRVRDLIKGELPPGCRQGFPSEIILQEIKDNELRKLVEMMLAKQSDERLSAKKVIDFLNGKKLYSSQKKQRVPQQNKNIADQQINPYYIQQKHQGPQSQIKNQDFTYKFSYHHKSNIIELKNGNLTATNPKWRFSDDFVLVNGAVLKKGSSIRYKIQSIGLLSSIWVGLGNRNIMIANSYTIKNCNFGHGGFFLDNHGFTYTHLQEQSGIKTGFKYKKGDIVRVETNEEELLFFNETRKLDFKMKINLSKEQWQQACFCVLVGGFGDSVTIWKGNSDQSCSIQ